MDLLLYDSRREDDEVDWLSAPLLYQLKREVDVEEKGCCCREGLFVDKNLRHVEL